MGLMRSHRLSAVVDGAEHPCRAQGACVHAIGRCLIIGEQMANMPLPQCHDMVEALASDRSDQPFNMTVLATANVARLADLGCPMARSRRVTKTP